MSAPTASAASTTRCTHCGTPFRARAEHEQFCCAGCEYVHRLLNERGLTRFYELKDRPVPPVGSSVFHQDRDEWLETRARQAEAEAPEGRPAVLDLGLSGISCVGCVWLVEKLFQEQPGAARIAINAQLGQTRLQWQPGAFELGAFARELQRFGYRLGPLSRERPDQSRGLALRIGVCGFLALNAMLFTLPRYLGMEADFRFARLFELLGALLATLSMAVGGTYFIERAVRGLRRGVLHIDLPIALGLVVAWVASLAGWLLEAERLLYFDFVSVFVFLMLVGRWLQETALERNRNRLLDQGLHAPTVTRLSAGDDPAPTEAETPVSALRPGHLFAVRPGKAVPVRARLLQEQASLSLEWINGEAEPHAWGPGRFVPSGALNIGGEPLALEALESWEDSLLARLLTGAQEDARRNRLLERILQGYLFVVLALAAAGAAGWLIVSANWVQAVEVLVAVLVVSCPCALGVAWPLTEELAASGLRRHGIFLRESGLWSRLRRVRHVFFDKTGTLTLESPRLDNPEALAALSPGHRQVLYRLVEHSLHPVGRSLRENLLNLRGFRPEAYPDSPDARFSENPGQGVGLSTPVGSWSLGRPGWRDAGPDTGAANDCVFAHEGTVLAAFTFSDAVRRDAPEEVAGLRAAGLGVRILSGDRQEKVDTLSRDLGIDREFAEGALSPEDKRARVLEAGAGSVLMVGDGANDSLAFDAAAVRATPVVDKGLLEHKADFYFLGQDLSALRRVFALGRRRRGTLARVFAFTTSYNVVAVSAALAGWMSPLVAAIIMPLSSLVSLALAAAGMRGGRR